MTWTDVLGIIIVILGVGVLLFPLQLPSFRKAKNEEEQRRRIGRDRAFGFTGAILIAIGVTVIVEL